VAWPNDRRYVAIVAILHLVPRPRPEEPTALARALVDAPWAGADADAGRVIELFEPTPAATVVDLSLADRDVPEIVALLHQCTEVHVHGIHPQLAMNCLPEVRPAVLTGVALVVHGPIAPLLRALPREAKWPGPVRADALAAATLGDAIATGSPCVAIDPADAVLLPRACGAVPLELDDGTTLAVVGLVAELPEAVRIPLRFAIEALNRPSFRVDVCDEATVPVDERLARRRALQCVVLPEQPGPGWSREMLESVAQGLPILVLGESRPDAPPGVLFAGPRADHDRCVACLRAWTSTWAHGHAVAVNADARAAWLKQQQG
jgi:hypothetical protein